MTSLARQMGGYLICPVQLAVMTIQELTPYLHSPLVRNIQASLIRKPTKDRWQPVR